MAKTRWFFATCARGLENLLHEEVIRFGPAEARQRTGGVSFRSEPRVAYAVCLWSRVASHVLEELARHKVSNAEELYEAVHKLEWQRFLKPGQTLAVRASGHSGAFKNTHFAALKVKDAIVDALRESTGERPDVDVEEPDLPLRVHLAGKVMTLSRDLSGASLHKRGYRTALHKSPLNEALAAGLVLLSGWDRSQALLDPMCGSATLLIEAAWIAGDRAPGLGRSMRFERWPDHDPALWALLQEEAAQRWEIGREHLPELVGGDLHPGAVRLGREACAAAGVEIPIHEADIATMETSARFVVCNPPYGERLEGPHEAWEKLGDFLRRHPGMEAWVLSGDPTLTRALHLKADRKIPVRNGGIDCRWVRYLVRGEPASKPASSITDAS